MFYIYTIGYIHNSYQFHAHGNTVIIHTLYLHQFCTRKHLLYIFGSSSYFIPIQLVFSNLPILLYRTHYSRGNNSTYFTLFYMNLAS